MRMLHALSCGLFLLFLSTGSLSAQSVTGRWVFLVELDVGTGDATFQLQQHGDSIAGTYSGVLGEGIRISGKIQGDEIEFWFDSEAGKITYKGKLSGTTMEGTCDYGQLGPGTFKGSKAEDLPASLGDRAYLDVFAYILQSNGYLAADEARSAPVRSPRRGPLGYPSGSF